MSKSILLTILILNFNRSKDLLETLCKVNDINNKNIEILIVDNGSTDESPKIIKQLDSKKYKKIFIKDNKGSAFGHQTGMQAARGELIVTLDDDAFINPNNIDICINYFKKFPKLAAIGFGMVNPNTEYNDKDYHAIPISRWDKKTINNSYETVIATSAAIFRKSALADINYYDLNWNWYTEDLELCMRLIHKGYNTINMPELIAYHKSSLVNRNFNTMTQNSIEGMIMIYFKFFNFHTATKKYLQLLLMAISNSIYTRDFKYIKYSIISFVKLKRVLENRKLLNKSLLKKIKLPLGQIFSRL